VILRLGLANTKSKQGQTINSRLFVSHYRSQLRPQSELDKYDCSSKATETKEVCDKSKQLTWLEQWQVNLTDSVQ